MEEIRNWLRGFGLDRYFSAFIDQGWETFEDLETISDADLKACIPLAGHRQRFRNEMRKRKQVRSTALIVRTDGSGNTSRDSNDVDDDHDGKSDNCYVTSMLRKQHSDGEGESDHEDHVTAHSLKTLGCSPDTIQENIEQLVPSTQLHIQSAGNVRNYKGCTIYEDGNRQHECFKAQMQTMMESFEKKDRLFVETRAFKRLVEIVDDRHMAVITGLPGDGKTTMAYHLSLHYHRKGYEHLELHFAKDWKDYVDGTSGKDNGKKQFVIIDDIFGRMGVDERKLSEWISLFDLIQNIVVQRKGDLIVVCTCRKYVYNAVKTKLSRFSLFTASFLIDITSDEGKLNTVEKKAIWHKYAKEYSINIDTPSCIYDISSNPHGFPHCVELFCTDFHLRKQGEAFFENPMQCVTEQLTHFMDNQDDRLKYCVLLMILLRGNKLQKSFLDDLSGFESIFRAAGLAICPTKIDLLNALESLTNTYVTYLNSFYRISHDSVSETLAYMFIKSNTKEAIELMAFIYLTDHTRSFDQGNNIPEETVYILTPAENKLLASRMIKEIVNGNVVAVCAHKAWKSMFFVDEFIKTALSNPDTNTPVMVSDPRNIFNTKDNSSSCIFYFDIFEALQFFNHMDTVKKILDNSALKPLLQDVIFTPSGRNTETPLSNVLSKTLNNMGYDDDTRRTFRESNTTMEILDTLCLDLANRNYSCTILGGQAEGAYVTSKGSKASASVRYLFCRNDLIVNGDINELSPNNNVELLMVSDEITKPGYVKLQVVLNGVPQKTKGCDIDLPDNTQADYRNRLCIFKTHPDMLRVEKHLGLETTTRMITGDKPDILYESYKCESWPDVARNWQNRVRHYNWPSRYDLEQMKALGILLVPVGCSDSIERHLEFKICFFLQERYLMDTLNETQHKCYVLLKMINNSIISGLVNESALISYHLKMCLFHVIENTSVGTWTPSNLLCCLRHCLNCVLKCTISGLCPDYFNPHENLFCGRIHGELQSKLRNVLEMLLQSDFYFLTYIECGNLGGLLKKAIRNEPLRTDESQDLVSNNIESYIEKGRYVVLVKDRILSRCYNEDLETCLQQHLQMIKRLRAIDTLAGHSKSETQRAIGLALSWVELSFMNNLVAWAVTREDRTEIRDILFSHQWNINARDTSAFSAKLKQATYMHMQRFHTSSLEILNGLKGLLGPHKISICGCRFFMKTILSKQMKVELMQASDAEIRKIHCMPCLIFLPTELVPEAIRNTTSTNSASNSERTSNRFGNKWAVVDSKVLLFYLLYLNHSELKMSNDAVDDIEQLLKVLKNDQNLGHKETGWSILGWIYSQEGQHDRARVCFIESSTQLDAYMTASTRRISRVCESGSVMQK